MAESGGEKRGGGSDETVNVMMLCRGYWEKIEKKKCSA
jgi:hypothetical protein